MTHEQKPESGGFGAHITLQPCPRCASSGESAVRDYANPPHPLAGTGTHRIKCGICGYYVSSILGEDGATIYWNLKSRGAAEQRRKDAEGAEPAAWLIEDRCKGDPRRAHTPDSAVTDKAHADKAARFNFKVSALYTRPANVAALIAEAVAAERERCAKVCEERRETFADPAYAGGPIGAVSEMFACKACAAAIREGGEG